MVRSRRRSSNLEADVLRLILSCIFGFVFFSYILKSNRIVIKHLKTICAEKPKNMEAEVLKDDEPIAKMLYIGMMSTKDNLPDRAATSIDTWMRHIPDNVVIEIFSSNNGSLDSSSGSKIRILSNGVRVIELPGVKDRTYPPQKKSFSMIKYMHDHYLDEFEWFLRLDDDAYVKLDKLVQFLSRVNSSKELFIGQPGFGINELDYVGSEENYCMGGPGIIFSRELLSKLAPKLQNCMYELLTEHEDVELGRCVIKTTQAKCTTAWDSNEYFYQNYPPKGSKEVVAANIEHIDPHRRDLALVFHSNKDAAKQYLLHKGVLSDEMNTIIAKSKKLREEIYKMNIEIKVEDRMDNRSDNYMTWSYVHGVKNYHHFPDDLPVISRTSVVETSMQQLTTLFHDTKRKEHRYMYGGKLAGIEEVLYSVNPLKGLNVKTTILQEYKKKQGKVIKKTNFQWEVPLSEENIFFIEDHSSLKSSMLSNNEKVTFIVPISGRSNTLVRFLTNFEHEFLYHHENVNLILTVFGDNKGKNSVNNIVTKSLKTFEENYKFFRSKIITPKKAFSRGLGLHLGVEEVSEYEALMFFCDVDIIITRQLVINIRRNTIKNKQVYYPTVFGEYNPVVTHATDFASYGDFVGSMVTDIGLWRTFSYGMVSLYKSDYQKSGGFDLSLEGWGFEDLKFLSTIQDTGIRIFRSNEPGLIHGYHDKVCDKKSKQYQPCVKSRAQQIASTSILSRIWRKKKKKA